MRVSRINLQTHQRGTLLAVALLIMVISGLFVASWVGLLGTRAQHVSLLEDACARRVGLLNSKMISRQLMLQNAFVPGATVSANTQDLLESQWGGYDVGNGWTGLNVMGTTESDTSMATVYPYSFAAFRPTPSYLVTEVLDRPAGLDGTIDPFRHYSFMKGVNPMLAGDLFTVYRKPDVATSEIDVHSNNTAHHANWRVEGRVVIRDVDSLFAPSTPNPLKLPIRCTSLYLQDANRARAVYGVDRNGTSAAASNMASVPSTSGKSVVATPGGGNHDDYFSSYLNVVKNDDNPDNSLWHFMNRESNAGRTGFTTIDTTAETGDATSPFQVIRHIETVNPPLYPQEDYPGGGYPPVYPVLYVRLSHAGLTHLRILASFQDIVFEGQTTAGDFASAGLAPPIMVTVVTDGLAGISVPRIKFVGDNNRRFVLGLRDSNGADANLYWVGNPEVVGAVRVFDWRMMLVNEYRTVFFQNPIAANQSIKITGGVMTNWTCKRSTRGGSNALRLQFLRDETPDPAGALGASFRSLLPRDLWLESYFLAE